MAALVALLSSPSLGMAAGKGKPAPAPAKTAPVDLGSAGNFVILSTAGITDVSPSAIVGNIGTSPITGAFIGVPCTEVDGTMYSVDAAGPACAVEDATLLGLAVLDMGDAYIDGTGRAPTSPTIGTAGDITGLTIYPGVYNWASVVTINAPGVILKGTKDDVWIFQIAQGLTVGTGAIVTLSGGAQAKNIFWVVGTQTTLEAAVAFKGIILSETAIVLKDGASLVGRALAGTEVTLIQNTVVAPNVTKPRK